MLKFSEPDLIKLVLEYGLEDSKLSQHSITSKRQFELYSQNQETIIVHDSSDDESNLPDAQSNLRTIPVQIDPILEKQIQTFRACALTDYLIDVDNDGIYGSMVQQIGTLFSLMNPQYAHEYFTVGNVPITYYFLSCIFKGIHISQIESSFTAVHNLTFSQNSSWLEDKHFDCFIYLIERQNYRNSHHQDPSTPVIIDPHFYPCLLFNTQKALLQLWKKLSKFNLLSNQGWLAKILLFPISLLNNHWILVHLDCSTCSFWTFDPFSPTQPTQEHLEIAEIIAKHIQNEFGLSVFSKNMPLISTTLPTQKDNYNCGVYVLWYLLLLTLKANIIFHDQYGADMLRILLCAWVFHKEITPF